MKKITFFTGILLFSILTLPLFSMDKNQIEELMQGQSYYRNAAVQRKGIDFCCIGYDEADNVRIGIISGTEDLYEEVTIVMTVTRTGGEYKITGIDVPDIENINDTEKRSRLEGMIAEYRGLSVESGETGTFTVDVVSGASRFIKKGHKTLDSFFRILTEEMELPGEGEKFYLN